MHYLINKIFQFLPKNNSTTILIITYKVMRVSFVWIQQDLATNFNDYINELINKNVDFTYLGY